MNHRSDTADPKQVVEQGYDRVAQKYARLEDAADWPRMRWLTKLLNRLQPGASILDLGCGSSVPADVEVAKQHQIIGVDISHTQLALARQNVPTGTFLHADAGSVRFGAASFDAVLGVTASDTRARNSRHWPSLPRC
jgi:ubiquinone/menaquinone biosynthesis C-methylase UbiE